MPGVVRGAVPVATFPITLSTKFTETSSTQANTLEYHDGGSQRKALVATNRKSWNLSKRLGPTDLVALRTFWEANAVTAFHFYNPIDAITYLVRFASDWSQSMGMVRGDASVDLIEVATDAEILFYSSITNPTA